MEPAAHRNGRRNRNRSPPPLVNGRFATIMCWVAVFTCWIDVAASGNLDTSFPVIFKGNDQSHFGYTVEIISNRDGNLTLVGAIKDQSTSNFQGANHTGALHKCRLDTGGCTEVPIQRDSSTDNIDSATAEYQYRELNDHMHLGMSLVSQPGPEGRVVVCAPKWKNQKYAETLYMLNGACYVMNKNLDDIKVLRPLIRKAFQVIEPETYLHALAEAGFSTHISQDNELILGTPGSMDWTGSLVTYGIPSDPEGELKLKVIGRLSTLKVPQIQQYIGYSVASGNFFESMGRSFVAGAPRDTADYRGAVYFFKPETPDSSNLNVQLKKEGEQMGSYFGASVLAIDLNMDNFTDLLVGAPLYSLQGTNGDEGKVYVYLSNGASLQLQDLKIMGSSVPGARFGSTIVNIGDLNLDGYPDVAIGSPYEHGYGAVYIYNGGKDGLKTTPAQIIEGRSTEGSPHGFGISISKAMDIDGNNYPDIVVGAYQSDQAYLFRAMPVVQARSWIEIDTKHVSSNKPNCVRNNVAFFCFPVTPCLQYDGKYVPEQIDFEFTIEMDTKKQEAHRGAFELLGGRTGISIREVRPLQRGRAMCFPQKALVFSNVQDLLTPFEFRLTFNISDGDKTRRDGFCSTCPVLDASTITTVTNRTVFQVACGPDNVCWADLILKASIVGHEDSSPLVVGKDNVVSLAINVKNRDDTEPAYLSRVEISLPENVDFVNIGTCESKGNATVSCDVGNPLNPGSVASVSIKLGLTKIKKKLEIHVAARTDSVDTDTSNNDITIALPVIYHADIGLQGSSSIGQLIYNESTGIVQVVHTFTMVKYFDSPINKVAVSISVPLKIHGKKDPFLKLEGVKADDGTRSKVGGSCNGSASVKKRSASAETVAGHPRSLREASALSILESRFPVAQVKTLTLGCSDAECVWFTCQMGPFASKNKVAKIELHMTLNVTRIMEQVGTPDTIDIATEGSLTILDETEFTHFVQHQPRQNTIVTSLVKEGPPAPYRLPWWVYLLIVLGGLFLLLLIIYVLYRCGFFRRKAKEDLERSKRESLAASSVAHSPTTENPPSMPGDDPEVRTSLLAPEARE
ncbi:integrin alpha-4 [Ixodes scapularis]|uniref:integrin alpha-4 n=1 Tax=Ixodes scapularis TaxID=6945 RepID=UPI001C3899DF|nr:integrin alpha-4 [Ixodes scapularis]